MSIAKLDRLERKAAERKQQKEQRIAANSCQCDSLPVITITPTAPDGTQYPPTAEQIAQALQENSATGAEICPKCNKPYRPGTLARPAFVIGRNTHTGTNTHAHKEKSKK